MEKDLTKELLSRCNESKREKIFEDLCEIQGKIGDNVNIKDLEFHVFEVEEFENMLHDFIQYFQDKYELKID